MGYVIRNRLIGLVNKTLKMSFFQENFHFHNLSLVLDQWCPKNGHHWRKAAIDMIPENLF